MTASSGSEDAQPEFGALQWRRSLEVVEIDALREFFCGASSGHVSCPLRLVLQRHHRMHCAQYD